jgi:hypothetical protein
MRRSFATWWQDAVARAGQAPPHDYEARVTPVLARRLHDEHGNVSLALLVTTSCGRTS